MTERQNWSSVPNAFRNRTQELPPPWAERFGPLRNDMVTVGQIGQSLDGRIATPTGHSHYINGEDGLCHLHQLRSLMDAVMVGAGTVMADDPLLTVRRVEGPHPARVVIDPNGRIPGSARVFAADGVRRLVLTANDTHITCADGIEVIRLPRERGALDPAAMLHALRERGLNRTLVEGGANTVSRFLAAGCLDRLHIVVAPIILGSGPAGIALPPIERADEALRVPVRIHRLGDEVLFDCDVSGQDAAGRANTSM